MKSEELAQIIARIAAEKKAEDIIAIDLRGISSFTDFMVVCSGSSEPQLKAIIQEIDARLREEYGVRPSTIDGFPTSQWVVADYSDVVVHVFHTQKRSVYSLEELWNDAPRLPLDLETNPA